MLTTLNDPVFVPQVRIASNQEIELSYDEYERIKRHSLMGAAILKNIEKDPKFERGAKHHTERYDGTGYPDGLVGNEIPEAARIIAVADAYDAMTSNRSYRDQIPQDKVRSEFDKCSGTQFDPRFADIMMKMIDEDVNYDMKEKKNRENKDTDSEE